MTRLTLGLTLFAIFASTSAGEEKVARNTETEAIVLGNTEFALQLYDQLRVKKGNLFFSPFSISSALGMTYAGAREQTAEEMAKTLHFPLDQTKLHPAMAKLMAEINGQGKEQGYQLTVADALWAQKGYRFLPTFLALNKKFYGAGVQEVDFVSATEQARKTINTWVEEQTQNKIKELLKKGILTVDTRMVLTNAIYFKGNWATQFKKDRTVERSFYVGADQQVKTPMMNQEAKFGYNETKEMQLLEMPYQGKHLSMVLLLPKKRDGLADLEKGISAENVAEWLRRTRQAKVNVSIPKFKMTSEFSLNKTLAAMGMPSAFSAAKANFAGIDGKSNYLYIQAIVHKAFVDVNEEGTEAAAATAVVIGKRSAPQRLVFLADHPFVFLIRDKRNDSILFMGRVSDPTK